MSDDRPDSGGPPEAADERTLFERIGGMKTLVNGVDVFYDMVLEDGMLAPFFEGVDQARQRIKQVKKGEKRGREKRGFRSGSRRGAAPRDAALACPPPMAHWVS